MVFGTYPYNLKKYTPYFKYKYESHRYIYMYVLIYGQGKSRHVYDLK